MNHDELTAAIQAWAQTQNAAERAAASLLIDHGHWLRVSQFVNECVGEDEGIHFIKWWRVRELLYDWGLTGTNSELAILRFAAMLAGDSLGLTSLDRVGRTSVVNALSTALNVWPL